MINRHYSLTGVLSFNLYKTYSLKGALVESPRVQLVLESEVEYSVRVFTFKGLYFKSERAISLETAYNSFPQSFNLVGFYYRLIDNKFFALEGTYKVNDYFRINLYGRYTRAQTLSFKIISSYKRHALSMSFIRGDYSKVSYKKYYLEGQYTFVQKAKDIKVFYLLGSYGKDSSEDIFNTETFYIAGELIINKKTNNSYIAFEVSAFENVIVTFCSNKSFTDFISEEFNYRMEIFRNALELYSPRFTLATPYKDFVEEDMFDLCSFSAEGYVAHDFYSSPMRLVVIRRIKEYSADDTVATFPIIFQNIPFKTTETVNFIQLYISFLDLYKYTDMVKTPNYDKNLFYVEPYRLFYGVDNLIAFALHNVDKYPTVDLVDIASALKKRIVPRIKVKEMFAAKIEKSFYLDKYKFLSILEYKREYADFTLDVKLINWADMYLLEPHINYNIFDLEVFSRTPLYSKVTFTLVVSMGMFSEQELSNSIAFVNNLHRHFYCNEDVNIINSFFYSNVLYADVSEDLFQLTKPKPKIQTDNFLNKGTLSVYEERLEFSLLQSFLKIHIFPTKTSDFLYEADFHASSSKEDIEPYYYHYMFDINSHDIEPLIQEIVKAEIRLTNV